MALSLSIFGPVKSAATFLLSLLLFVTPLCTALCDARACDLPNASEKSPCHESAGSIPDHADSSVRAERSCGLRDLPVALPADCRSLRLDSVASMHAATQLYMPASASGLVLPLEVTSLLNLQRVGSLGYFSPPSIVPLRI